jgi:beta-glucanase (GH16 family)
MKRTNQIIFLNALIILFSIGGCKKVEEVGGCNFPESMDSYQLVWSDEFDGTSIDESKWSYDLGDGCDISPDLCGWGNNELEYYTDRSENSYISEGKLVIEARKESPLYLGQHQYTSARMVTKNKGDWTYGRIDVRAKMPIGQGLWPAIWMLPTENVYGGWPKSGEIDIMEYLGHKPSEVLGTIHYGHDFWRFNSQYLELEEGTFADDFHVFTVLWTEDCILFQMDGKDIGVPNTRSTVLPTTYPFDQDFHLILNVAVGGNLPGNPDASTVFPQTMEVDYVRVYQEK